ncbi:hypothetical protein CMV_028540 [Castanea mollissima]|uniref:Uncharacterized protein n=1 Tax=Castanea mollissima TaxID=60419 RepID=A0A8J4VE98_9ROSI|nr:hypothetical protein CMV_028540 [Castanea mollissima]
MLLDTQSPSGLLNQVMEIIGILPSRCFDGKECFDDPVDIYVDISINGYKNREKNYYICDDTAENTLYLFSPPQRSLQRLLNESNPADQNLVDVSITSDTFYYIKRLGVQVDDVVEYLPTSKKQRTR